MKDIEAMKPQEFDMVGAIMRYESGEMSEDEIDEMFQRLVDSGLAWSLQGHYGRTAKALIEAGRVFVDDCVGL